MEVRTKRIILILVMIMMFVLTMKSALSFSIDDDDTFYVTKGDIVEGNFVIEDFTTDIKLKSNMEWVSLSSDKYISERPAIGEPIIENNFVFSYWVEVPKDADIGIYRGTIEVIQGNTIKYLNIKISVQNGVVTAIYRGFNKPIIKIMSLILSGVVLVSIFIISLRRALNVSKR